MMKKIIVAMLILSMMLSAMLSFTACGDEKKPPIVTDPVETGGDGTQPGNTEDTEPVETEPAGPEEYEPDPDAKHSGAVGFGTDVGNAYFDAVKIVNKANNKKLYEYTFDDELMPESQYGVSVGGAWDKDAADWSVTTDPIEVVKEGEEAKNHVLGFTGDTDGSMLYFGSTDWNYYQYALKFLPADEETIVSIYFLVKDENNYYVLNVGEENNTCDCYQVVDGVKTSVVYKMICPLTTDAWNSVGITVDRETVIVYVNGNLIYTLFDPDAPDQSNNVALFATYEAPLCSSWESAAGLNDTKYGTTTFEADSSSNPHYGSWGQCKENVETLTYSWGFEVTVDSIGLFFWRDKADYATWLSGGGINPPASYTLQYWNGEEYVDVTNAEGYEVADDTMNVTTFDAVTTTSLQLTLYKFSEADLETVDFTATPIENYGLGITEWEVYKVTE